jgi:hypothetical protein
VSLESLIGTECRFIVPLRQSTWTSKRCGKEDQLVLPRRAVHIVNNSWVRVSPETRFLTGCGASDKKAMPISRAKACTGRIRKRTA